MSNIIMEIAAIIGKSEREELKMRLMDLISRPIPHIDYVIPEAVKTADILLHYYVSLRAKKKLSKGHEPDEWDEDYAEKVLLVASKLLIVAVNGFDEQKPELIFQEKIPAQ